MTMPESIGWVEHQSPVDETVFTPWAEKGWLSHNGQSPEIAVMDFVRNLVRMMCPKIVLETGVGQGYMTRTVASALCKDGLLIAYESDPEWHTMLVAQRFWEDRRGSAQLSHNQTPLEGDFQIADLCILDSEFLWRFEEVRAWNEHAKAGAVAVIHDTSDRDGTIHQKLRELIVDDLGMTGVFLNNPRGSFMAVQPAK